MNFYYFMKILFRIRLRKKFALMTIKQDDSASKCVQIDS